MARKTAVIMLLALAACDPKVDHSGYVTDADWQAAIVSGQTTKDDVRAAFGSPSAQSSFGTEIWYYVSARKETFAFLAPEVVQQDTVQIEFAENGTVRSVARFDKKGGKTFEIVKRVTPTEGHRLGFFEQIIGNVGRFNKGSDGGAAPGRRSGR